MLKRTLALTTLGLASMAPGANADSVRLVSDTLVAQAGVPATLSGTVVLDTPRPVVNALVITGYAGMPASPSWITVDVPQGPFTPRTEVPFTAVVSLPAKTRDGRFAFGVVAEADGAPAGRAEFVVEVGVGARPLVMRKPALTANSMPRSLVASLEVSGFSPMPGQLFVNARGPTTRFGRRKYKISVGEFSRTILLPFQPGEYSVFVLLRSSGSVLGSLSRSFQLHLAPPPEGYVDDAWISGKALGRAATHFRRGTVALYATFHYKYLPQRGPITTTWYLPDGSPTRAVVKHRAQFVRGFVKATGSLNPGRWRCVLRVGGVVVGERDVYIG